ncbi:hypothetical protein [Nostoc sp. CCY 9925]|uniref:hypothetical protein n=1 Tax=Nostoc sp. CCY 9925 TaxID=3103865 RepID=UPI0039C6C422
MPSKSQSRYPENWSDIALDVKQHVGWRCFKCRLQCIRPLDDTKKLTRSLKMEQMQPYTEEMVELDKQ